MRCNWMVGDKATISVSGNAWRPPDYITTPTLELSKQRKNYEQSEGETIITKINLEPLQEVQHATRLATRKQSARVDREVSRRWRKILSHKSLPLPPTHIESNYHRFRFLFRPRLFALFVAIVVAFSVLIGLAVLFSEKLDEVASKVDKAAGGGYSRHRFSQVGTSVTQNSRTQRRRKLLTTNAGANPHAVQMLLPHNTVVKAISTLYSSAETIRHIMRVLRERQPLVVTAAVLHNTPRLTEPAKARTAPYNTGRELKGRFHSLHDEKLRMYRDLIAKQLHTPLQITQGEPKSSHTLFDLDSSTLYQNHLRGLDAMYQPPSSVTEASIPKQSDSTSPQHSSSVLHSHALTVVGDVDSSERSRRIEKNVHVMEVGGSESRKVGSVGFHSANLRARVHNGLESKAQNPLLKVDQSRAMPAAVKRVDGIKVDGQITHNLQTFNTNNAQDGSSLLPERIEVWQLPGGKSLCRLFNIGYLADGTLVLPKWMRKHAEIILSRCGIKDVSFAINHVEGTKPSTFDGKILQAEGMLKFNVDASNAERDLFGTSAPRNHMPHFVSDVFFHLVACEALLGSGKKLLHSTTLVPANARGMETISVSNFPHLQPAMFLQDDTWNRPRVEWVPRLAQFFRHPEIGFKFLRKNGESIENSGLGGDVRVITMFRSVLLSNLKSHEPFGLFGANGTNIVLEANGITRNPAWNTMGMREQPCRVLVTVLTRQGPRALLRLKELQNSVELSGKLAGIRMDIKVVDFGGMTFDEQVRIMQGTNILIATHGAGNSNFIFMRPSAAVIEVFPFAYKAGPFDRFAEIFGLEYKATMSAPQTDVFKECMNRHETNQTIKRLVFAWWDKAVAEERIEPWVHRLELEKEFGEPGKSEGMTTRGCVRLQELEFNIDAVSRMVVDLGSSLCALSSQTRHRSPRQASTNSI